MVAIKSIFLFLSSPPAFLAEVREQPLKTDILSFIAVTLVGSILFFASSVLRVTHTGPGGVMDMAALAAMAPTVIFVFVINALFFLLVTSLIGHFFVAFIGEHRGFERTMKSMIYASFLPVLFLWVPAVFHVKYSSVILAGAFMVYSFFGIRTFHETSKDRAAFVALFTTGFIMILLWFGKVVIP